LFEGTPRLGRRYGPSGTVRLAVERLALRPRVGRHVL